MINPKPVVTHIGMKIGEWPIRAFSNEGDAAYWASRDTERHRVWPVERIDLGPEMRGETQPEQHSLTVRDA
jgi:hypothetical protein